MPLKRPQFEELRRAISARRTALHADIRREVARARGEPYSEVAGSVSDAGDQSVADLVADIDQAEISRDVAELRELEAAEERMAAGSYGVCADCGEDIPLARLRASPGAGRCMPCQERHEKTYRS